MDPRRRVSLVLAAMQTGDVIVTLVSPKYGDAHLDHLGVAQWLRPMLPMIKLAAVGSLVVTSNRPRARSVTGAVLVAYYSAATTFHVLSGDSRADSAPAAAFGASRPRSSEPTRATHGYLECAGRCIHIIRIWLGGFAMTLRIICLCGYFIQGADEDELWRNAQDHMAVLHPELVGNVTRDDILAQAERL